MEIQQHYIRLLRPWSIVNSDIRNDVIMFERTIFNTNKNRDHKTSETLDFSQTDISEYIRLCFASYIILGKITPPNAQSIIDEYKIYHATAAHHNSPETLKDFLSLLSDGLLGVFDDPMQGVLTGPFHKGLFDDETLVNAFDSVCSTTNNKSQDILIFYSKAYTKFRQYILDIAFCMAREIPSLTDEEIHSGEEFFTWWKHRWNRKIQIRISEKEVIPLFLPDLPEKTITMTTKIIQGITNDYDQLAQLLDRPHAVVQDFIRSFVIELNEGMVNLPLNQYGKEACPVAKDLETEIKRSAGFPTTAPYIKEVRIGSRVLEDVFKRFFAVKQASMILPRTQQTIVISQLGGCPFADYGFIAGSFL